MSSWGSSWRSGCCPQRRGTGPSSAGSPNGRPASDWNSRRESSSAKFGASSLCRALRAATWRGRGPQPKMEVPLRTQKVQGTRVREGRRPSGRQAPAAQRGHVVGWTGLERQRVGRPAQERVSRAQRAQGDSRRWPQGVAHRAASRAAAARLRA